MNDRAVNVRTASIAELYEAARAGDRRALGRLLTKVERGSAEADEISELAHPDAGNAHIVGVTGAPGSGKSTLVGQLVADLVEAGRRPAVLAVDPSSPLTGGAILGDRIRIDIEPAAPSVIARKSAERPERSEGVIARESAEGPERSEGVIARESAERSERSEGVIARESASFVRSMATRGHSGGLALAVPLAVRLFDAVGYDPVIIETVGVGQVEVDVVGAADTAVVVLTPGMGDGVQANKAGLLEVADLFVVNKADRPGANDVRRDIDLMLDLSHMTGQESDTGYRPPIIMASALKGDGTGDVWDAVEAHLAHLDATGQRATRRQHRVRTEIKARMTQALGQRTDEVLDAPAGAAWLAKAERAEIAPTWATTSLLELLLDQTKETP